MVDPAKGQAPQYGRGLRGTGRAVAEGIGVYLWDVVFEKEGAGWYLRYFIDKDADGGVTIDECEAFSRAMSDLLDEKDPIPQSYTLEVGSPGVEPAADEGLAFQEVPRLRRAGAAHPAGGGGARLYRDPFRIP